MRILITGAGGRLGGELARQLQARQHTITGVDVGQMDITDFERVQQMVAEVRPELVLHCAALTAVDYCAEHPDEALAINGYGTQAVAQACQAHDAALLYVSTNEVFDGRARAAYQEYDRPNPPNPYGYSKWVGEQLVRDLVARHFIVRTSWLIAHGGQNFVHAILSAAGAGQPLRVVTNEVASPTYSRDLAAAITALIETGRYGIYHLVNAGHCSRYTLARHVLDLAGYTGTPIEPITLAEYRRASCPPPRSILRNFAAARLGITLRPWQDAVAAFLEAERLREP
jgi:dTDP-4-dehydrorhamnose reductase